MAGRPRRIELAGSTDLAAVIESLKRDRAPRIVEVNGEEVAVILTPQEYAELTEEPRSKRRKVDLLALAGAWQDIDAEELIEEIYGARHESRGSPPPAL